MARCQHLVCNFRMADRPAGLEQRRLVRGQVQPRQALEDHIDGVLRAAFAIGILDAQQELAAMVAGEQEVEQGGYGRRRCAAVRSG